MARLPAAASAIAPGSAIWFSRGFKDFIPGRAMIIELRTYTFKPGQVPAFLAVYEALGLEVQKRILGHMIGYYTTEVGPLNQVVHLWGYDSFEDRARRRAELGADPGWQDYLAKALPLMEAQESKLLLPTRFSPAQ